MNMSPKNPAAPAPPPATLLPAFEELKPRLDSGDVLLFGGDSRVSRGIKRFTRCSWSHVALVARSKADGPPLLWGRPGVTSSILRTTPLALGPLPKAEASDGWDRETCHCP
jgi:hypothetical protein